MIRPEKIQALMWIAFTVLFVSALLSNLSDLALMMILLILLLAGLILDRWASCEGIDSKGSWLGK